MPLNDTWDWPVLLYIGTVILKRPESHFWRMTPRKFNALARAHQKLNPKGDGDDNGGSPQKLGYIDQIF